MTDLTQALTPISSLFALIIVIGAIVSSIFYARAKAKAANADGIANAKDIAMADMGISVEALRTQLQIQDDKIKAGDDERLVMVGNMTALQSQVDTLSKVPLAKIEQHMSDTTVHMANTNRLIEMLMPLIPQSVSVDTLTKTVTTNNRKTK